MIKKIKQYLLNKKKAREQKVNFKKMKKYYELLRSGALFIQFIRQDLKESKFKMNRHQRRRMERTLVKGELTEEIVNHYKNHVDKVLESVNRQLNPPKPEKEVDGAKLYKSLKEQEKKDGKKV